MHPDGRTPGNAGGIFFVRTAIQSREQGTKQGRCAARSGFANVLGSLPKSENAVRLNCAIGPRASVQENRAQEFLIFSRRYERYREEL